MNNSSVEAPNCQNSNRYLNYLKFYFHFRIRVRPSPLTEEAIPGTKENPSYTQIKG